MDKIDDKITPRYLIYDIVQFQVNLIVICCVYLISCLYEICNFFLSTIRHS